MKLTINADVVGSQSIADVMYVNSQPNAGTALRQPESPSAPESDALQSLAVFISHSSQDRSIGAALSDLLVRALRLKATEVRCTSVNGHRLAAGASVSTALRADLRDANVLIALVTPEALSSSYVLFELGARWGHGTPFFPVLARKMSPSTLEAPLSELNFLDLTEAAQVAQLIYEVGRLLKRPSEPSHTYNEGLTRVLQTAAELNYKSSL